MLEPQLVALMNEHENVVVKKIDLTKRGCEAANQMVRDYNQRSIPYLRIFGVEGDLLGTVVGADIEGVRTLIEPQAKKKS